ncbi:MAG: NHLP bacteriocin export ABC transporter permease/ATPase subunit [Candidatus Eremiobacterota bacterium]
MDKNNNDIINNENNREASNIPQLTTHDSRLTELIELGGNNPFLIDDPSHAWIVRENRVNIYSVYLKDNEITGTRNYICTVEKDGVFFGFPRAEDFGILAVGEAGTKVLKININDCKENLLSAYIDIWIEDLSKGLAYTKQGQKKFKLLVPDEETDIKKGENILSFDRILWAKNLKGSFSVRGFHDSAFVKENQFFPVSKNIWWHAEEDSTLKTFTTEKKISEDRDITFLYNFHSHVIEFLKIRLVEKKIDERELLEKKEASEVLFFTEAVSGLASIMKSDKREYVTKEGEDSLLIACKIIGEKTGIQFQKPLLSQENKKLIDPLTAITKASKVRYRNVSLYDRWWCNESGPFLSFLKDSNNPVAIIPVSTGTYEMIDPENNRKEKVTKEVAEKLIPFGYMFYRPFPARAVSPIEVIKFGFQWAIDDVKFFLLISIAVGLLGLIVPFTTGLIFSYVIPDAAYNQLLQIVLGIFIGSVSVTLFQILQSICLIRIETKMKIPIQAAIWDRILSLPCSFFRQFSSGDLASRSLGIDYISGQLFSGLALPSLLGAIYALFNFILLFYYDSSLSIIATIISVVLIVIIVLTSYQQINYQRELQKISGKLSGFVFQLINGISKLRVSGAHTLAFTKWAEYFSQQKKYSFKIGLIQNFLTTFNSTLPVITGIALFSFVIYQDANHGSTISTGNFIAFNTAFTAFISAMMQLGLSIALLINIVPVFERTKPIFETPPEIDENKMEAGELTGKLDVHHLTFKYKKDGPDILKDISFHVDSGEFIAFVGPSGAGKSTILRLLLGFETPAEGAIYYDEQNLAGLDLASLRSQIGVVIQNSKVMAGEIYYNIIGSSLLTMEDAWEAARLAGIEDDIKAMPMGMHTMVSEGGETFSGGQKQRLLIARAIARKPKIIIFDEATSALDNTTQAIVTESLNKLNATRIVIAHRLSTIINADRIYVVKEGSIVQTGKYEDLVNAEGPFKDLAKRQLS